MFQRKAGVRITVRRNASEYNCPYDPRHEDHLGSGQGCGEFGCSWRDVCASATVLEDELALTREDLNVIGEQRFATLGLSGEGKLLVVIYTYRGPDAIRIISAWKANRGQRARYEKGRG